MSHPLKLSKPRIFRETQGVKFHDLDVPGSNGLDLVEHDGASISPPCLEGRKQWYTHRYQTDNNRVLRGRRLFELFYDHWVTPHWFVLLDSSSGALEIPPGCLHRSYSGLDGSLLINQAIRVNGYSEETEFIPVTSSAWRFYKTHYYNCTPADVQMFVKNSTLPAEQ